MHQIIYFSYISRIQSENEIYESRVKYVIWNAFFIFAFLEVCRTFALHPFYFSFPCESKFYSDDTTNAPISH